MDSATTLMVLRRKAGISQQDLAHRMKKSLKTIYRWEKGEGAPDITEIPELAKSLGITINQLFGEEDGAAPVAAPVVSNTGTNNGTMAGGDAVPPTQTGTIDLPDIMPFTLRLKDQGNIGKMKDAIDIYKSSIAVLERAVQESVPA